MGGYISTLFLVHPGSILTTILEKFTQFYRRSMNIQTKSVLDNTIRRYFQLISFSLERNLWIWKIKIYRKGPSSKLTKVKHYM